VTLGDADQRAPQVEITLTRHRDGRYDSAFGEYPCWPTQAAAARQTTPNLKNQPNYKKTHFPPPPHLSQEQGMAACRIDTVGECHNRCVRHLYLDVPGRFSSWGIGDGARRFGPTLFFFFLFLFVSSPGANCGKDLPYKLFAEDFSRAKLSRVNRDRPDRA